MNFKTVRLVKSMITYLDERKHTEDNLVISTIYFIFSKTELR